MKGQQDKYQTKHDVIQNIQIFTARCRHDPTLPNLNQEAIIKLKSFIAHLFLFLLSQSKPGRKQVVWGVVR